MSNLLVLFVTVFVTLFVIAIIAFAILNFVGCPMYPSPKFACAECENVKEDDGIYSCKACTDEVTNEPLYCRSARGTKDCYKIARKASNEQQQE